ncbi:hypothetical protein F9B74_01530 [Pelistega sp. NLN82]|uniref:Tellurite resistance protein TerB n=1 Tax=Pelistega ratti TaxID=2652177 RepID=A0A6L9Y3N1_9BURK|nr:hypothetical protein [Pelistega ratti]NEN75011.1 hypothetical protein [Pelistega ratti]
MPIPLFMGVTASSDYKDQRQTAEKLSEREKKIILTELIGAGFSSGHFDEEEKVLVKFIAAELGLDEESFEELTEAMEKFFIANKELSDLVFE